MANRRENVRTLYPDTWFILKLVQVGWKPRLSITVSRLSRADPVTRRSLSRSECSMFMQQIKTSKNSKSGLERDMDMVPPEYPASNDSSICASLTQQQPSGWTLQELQSLRYFNKNECTVVPKLLDVVRSWQGESDMPVPQGYLVFIVMEKVPAVCITGQILGVQSCPAQQDQGLRASFRRSLT
ncbi:hypothetical protein RJZ56_004771 [Blastomyces dermatitidis]